MAKKDKTEDFDVFVSLAQVVADICEGHKLFNNEKSPFTASLEKNDFDDVVVVAGPNASGKSLIVKILEASLKRNFNHTHITVSIRERAGTGLDGMAGFKRTMMFGDEAGHSTGAVSASTMENAFSNVSNPDRHANQILMLDEPEMGLSEGYCVAMGQLIAENVIKARESGCFKGLVLVTHNKELVKSLISYLKGKPAFASTSSKVKSIDEYLSTREVFTSEDLLQLKAKSRDGHNDVDRILK